MYESEIQAIVKKLGEIMPKKRFVLSVAESLTGGLISASITSLPGSSRWFERGFVTYTNQSKHEMLGVTQDTLARATEVSKETANEMCHGAELRSHSDITVAVTGFAGPGVNYGLPAGTVFISWRFRNSIVRCDEFHFLGDRNAVRLQTVKEALQGILDIAQTSV